MPGYVPGPPQGKPTPKKRWYGVGAALLIVGLAIAGLVGVAMVGGITDAAPSSEHTFGNGETTTVHFGTGETKVIFVANPGEYHKVHCDVGTQRGSDDQVEIKNYEGSLTINQWQAVFTVTAQRSSDYAVTCEGAASDEFGVGGDAKVASLAGGVSAIVGGAFLCVIGVVTLIITAILRLRRRV